MEFGLAVQNNKYGACAEGMEASAEVAIRHGWKCLWVADHIIISKQGGPQADPWYAQYNVEEHEWMLESLLSLMYIGAKYDSILLGLGVAVPALRDAPQLGRMVSTLDTLTGGRVVAGLGVGDDEDYGEFENLGKADRFHVRGKYLDETFALWRHLFSGRTDPFEGRFHTLKDFTFQPLPPQGADFKIFASGRSDRGLARVGAIADGYLGSRWSPSEFEAKWPAVLARASENGRPRPYLATRVRIRIGEEPDKIWSLCGSPEKIVGELLDYERVGTDEIVGVFEAVYPEDIVREVERFQSEIVEPYREASAKAAL
jgi:alkanesulfonate monooxygenase SsuD/methylene tetrahydromethanopterin reductase-like flavin-dependent oxidoreductase (luciferase family)